MLDTIFRIVLPLYGALAIAGIAAHRARIRKQTGHDPVVIDPLHRRDDLHRHLERVLLVVTFVSLTDIVLNAALPELVRDSLAIPVLRRAIPLRWLGLASMTAGLLLSGAAILHMGSSWRIGIDSQTPGVMVSGGLYSRIRHPIYTGMLLVTLGLAGATADVLSMAVAVAACVALPIQARIEEQFLVSLYGDQYREYLDRTGRFWPRAL